MNEQENTRVVQELFAAFGRGDFQSGLKLLAEDVEWQSPVTRNAPAEISWAQPRRGRAQVAQFFQELGENTQPEPFEIFGITAQGDTVVVEGRNRGQVRSTGRSYEHDWVMVFTVRHGEIVSHRHDYDTADVLAAFRNGPG